MMTLDAASAAFLDNLRAAGGTPIPEQALGELRAGIRGASQALAPPVSDVHQTEDRRIPVEDGEITIRIYTPRDTTELLPIVVFYHGAGFVAGDLESHDSMARYYCAHADAIVIAVDYRQPPEHRFPVPVDDCYAALTWAAAHARDIGGDAARIAVTGDSAGGNLAAVVCQLASEQQGPRVAFQALLYPWVDLNLEAETPSRRQFGGGDYFLARRDMEWFRSQYLADPARQVHDPRASPIARLDLTGQPPALVITAGCDPLHDEGKLYADRLAAAGVPVEYRCFESTIHAFVSFSAAIPAGIEALAFVASRLRAALH